MLALVASLAAAARVHRGEAVVAVAVAVAKSERMADTVTRVAMNLSRPLELHLYRSLDLLESHPLRLLSLPLSAVSQQIPSPLLLASKRPVYPNDLDRISLVLTPTPAPLSCVLVLTLAPLSCSLAPTLPLK